MGGGFSALCLAQRLTTAMKFGKYLREAACPAWADQYVDYKLLKKCLKPFEDGVANQADEDRFLACLHAEIEKVRVCASRRHWWGGLRDPKPATHLTLASDVVRCPSQVDTFFNQKEAEFIEKQRAFVVKVR